MIIIFQMRTNIKIVPLIKKLVFVCVCVCVKREFALIKSLPQIVLNFSSHKDKDPIKEA